MNMIKQVESVEDCGLGGEDRAQVRSLTKALGIPVLATPMGKGRFLYNHGVSMITPLLMIRTVTRHS